MPSLEPGSVASREQERATALLEQARESLAAGDPQAALEAADEIVRRYPGARGSGEALEILARARLGLDRGMEAAEAADAYANLLGPSHPRFPLALLLQARGLAQAGEVRAGAEALLGLPDSSPDSLLGPGRDLLRELVSQIPPAQLETLVESAPVTSPLRTILAAELAVVSYLRGDSVAADRWALVTLAGPVEEREAGLARGVRERRLEEVLGRPLMLGAILPRSGVSPTQLQYAEGVQEGIQVAIEEFKGRLRRPVQLQVVDDEGEPLEARAAIRALEEAGAVGVVGPLSEEDLAEAAGERSGSLPIVSPFAYLPGGEDRGVFSLAGPDLEGARLVARYARDLGLETVAVVRPQTDQAGADASAFQEEFQDQGGIVAQEIVFEAGATFFQKELREVERIYPDGLFLPLAPREIQLFAPQITFYGLDTLGIQFLGTSGWTDDLVVLDVDSRHTDGIVAATTRMAQEESAAFQRFREAYEAYFHKSLRSEAPAFGYDAAALLLLALEQGPRTPEELEEALNRIEGFPGSTGSLTIRQGRVIREPHLVRIQNHELIYITPRFR